MRPLSSDRSRGRFSSSGALHGVEVECFSSHGIVSPRRAAPGLLVGTLVEGCGALYRSGELGDVAAGEVWLVEPDEVFGWGASAPARAASCPSPPAFSGVAIDLDPALVSTSLARLEAGVPGSPEWSRSTIRDPELASAIIRLADRVEARSPPELQHEAFDVLVGLLLTRGLRRVPAPESPARAAIRRVKGYLTARYDRKVPLDELEALAGLSRYHLIRRFTAEVGLPPHTFQVAVRVERARRLIRAGGAPIEVARDVGFSDQSHMSRHFKRLVGMTPGAYARGVGRDRRDPLSPRPCP